MTIPAPRRVAFTGYARSGKDTAALPLIEANFGRRAFGDIIKKQVDRLVKDNLGFSAYTEVDTQKNFIRPLLETWGDINYSGVMSEFFALLPDAVVNTRLCRVAEAREWRRQGGLIILVSRETDGLLQSATTRWEYDVVHALELSGLIDMTLVNDGTVEELHGTVRDILLTNGWPNPANFGDRPRTVRCSGFIHTIHGGNRCPA